MWLWQSWHSVSIVPSVDRRIAPPLCAAFEGGVESRASSSPKPLMNGLTPPWQLKQRGSVVRKRAIGANASIDLSTWASVSEQEAPLVCALGSLWATTD